MIYFLCENAKMNKVINLNFSHAGVAHNGVEKINVTGKDVLVTGAGPIGLLAAAVAKAKGLVRADHAGFALK